MRLLAITYTQHQTCTRHIIPTFQREHKRNALYERQASLDLGLGLVNLLGGDGKLDVFFGKMHLGGESGVGLPLSRGTGSALFEHLVDLLQSCEVC
jgi:hypothetical protein